MQDAAAIPRAGGLKKAFEFRRVHSRDLVCFGVSRASSLILGNEGSDSDCSFISLVFEGLENTTPTGKKSTLVGGRFENNTMLYEVEKSKEECFLETRVKTATEFQNKIEISDNF